MKSLEARALLVARIWLSVGFVLLSNPSEGDGPAGRTPAPQTARATDEGAHWIADSKGCRLYADDPQEKETVEWSGECRAGYGEGPGTIKWYVDGQLYETDAYTLKHGKAVGPGVTLSAEGYRFEGQFVDGKPRGIGILIAADGTRIESIFVNGIPTGKTIISLPNGLRLETTFENGQPVGKTVGITPDGTRVEGHLVDGTVFVPDAPRGTSSQSPH